MKKFITIVVLLLMCLNINPVKAQMTNYPEDYPWSSYQTMIGLSDDRIRSFRV